MDPVDVLRNLGGVATLGELAGQTTRRALRTAVQHERIVRLAPNRYALASVAGARKAAVEVGGVASHLSAAQHWKWKVKTPPSRHCITLPRSARRPKQDYEYHWRDIPDTCVIHDVTDRITTVIDCARVYERDVALCVADSALREGEVTHHELQIAAERSPRTGHANALWIAEHATALAANPFESVARAIALEVPGLHARPQVSIDGVGRVDLFDECLGIVIECDSFEFHATSEQLRRDVTRYTACARLGLVVVRFTWAQVMFEPDYVRDSLTEVVLWRQRQVRSA